MPAAERCLTGVQRRGSALGRARPRYREPGERETAGRDRGTPRSGGPPASIGARDPGRDRRRSCGGRRRPPRDRLGERLPPGASADVAVVARGDRSRAVRGAECPADARHAPDDVHGADRRGPHPSCRRIAGGRTNRAGSDVGDAHGCRDRGPGSAAKGVGNPRARCGPRDRRGVDRRADDARPTTRPPDGHVAGQAIRGLDQRLAEGLLPPRPRRPDRSRTAARHVGRQSGPLESHRALAPRRHRRDARDGGTG